MLFILPTRILDGFGLGPTAAKCVTSQLDFQHNDASKHDWDIAIMVDLHHILSLCMVLV